MSDIDLIREALDELHHTIQEAARRLAEHVRLNGDDPVAYALADRILVAMVEERRFRRLLRVEVAG